MIFRQLTDDDLGCASYLIGDKDAGVAAVVDPRLEIDEYLGLARYLRRQQRAHPGDGWLTAIGAAAGAWSP